MLWDVRVWSFFVWLITVCLFLGGFATPYPMPGNRVDVIVAFGGDFIPDGSRIGLWANVPSELSGTVIAVKAVLCVALVAIVVSLIGYILVCKLTGTAVQVVAFVSQLVAGIFSLIGIGIFRAATTELGEGFWMVAMAGGLFIVNGTVLLFMPCMEYQAPKWKTDEDVPLTSAKA